jgi:hypothetical protein
VEPANTRFAIDELTPEILSGIGEIVARWGYLQHQLGVIIRVALGLKKDVGRVLTVGMELGVLCGVLRTLSKTDRWVKDEKTRNDIKKLANDIQEAAEHRNNYAHGVFGYTEESPTQFVRFLFKQAEHRVTPDIEIITPTSLKVFATEARNLWVRAQELTHRLKRASR